MLRLLLDAHTTQNMDPGGLSASSEACLDPGAGKGGRGAPLETLVGIATSIFVVQQDDDYLGTGRLWSRYLGMLVVMVVVFSHDLIASLNHEE
jgi:hypothetical protein